MRHFADDGDEPTRDERVGDVAGNGKFLAALELCEGTRGLVVPAGEDAVMASLEHTDSHAFGIRFRGFGQNSPPGWSARKRAHRLRHQEIGLGWADSRT